MLKYAWQYKEALEQLYVQTIDDPRLKFLHCNGWLDFDLGLDKTTWTKLQHVSVNSKGEVIGYLCADLDLKVNSVSSLYVMNFYDKSVTFSKDFYAFLETLLQRYTKVNFSVVVGNPAETMYDRVVKKYGGRVVGVKEDHVNIEGTLHDMKMYEVMQRNYKEVTNDNTAHNPRNY